MRRTYGNKVVSGQYQTAVSSYGITYQSKDFGRTWGNVNIAGAFLGSIAMSADGKYQTGVGSENICKSKDFGRTWVKQYVSEVYFISVAMSADGKYQTAVPKNGRIYRSQDFGSTWNKIDGSSIYFSSVAMSSDGKYQVAVGDSTQIYQSKDYGVTFEKNYSFSFVSDAIAVAVASSGKYQTIIFKAGFISSQDYGIEWSSIVPNPGYNTESIAISADGKYQSRACGSAYVIRSENYGVTWDGIRLDITEYRDEQILYIAMSSDGKYQTAVSKEKGSIFRSEDFGRTWKKIATPNTDLWKCIAMNK